MYNIQDQINNRKVLVYPEKSSYTTESVVLTEEQITSTYFPEDIDENTIVTHHKIEIGEGNFIYNGDNMDVLKTLPDNSIDSCVTDPPYALNFMGAKWDNDVPTVELWKEVKRVLKPGGHILSFGSTRTYHRMTTRIEEAGFEIRDTISWIYGSGFPKSHNIGKSIDKLLGNERTEISLNPNHRLSSSLYKLGFQGGNGNGKITKGKSEFEGWGTGLKPAVEPICVARKPISEKSVAENVLKWRTGGINIDGCRVESIQNRTIPIYSKDEREDETLFGLNKTIQHKRVETILGRFPANIILDEEAGRVLDEQSGEVGNGWKKNYGAEQYRGKQYKSSTNQCQHGGGYNGKNTYSDKGGASRFFYCPKPSKKEKEEGLTNDPFSIKGRDIDQDNRNVPNKVRTSLRKNTHTTVKPVELMRYLIRLVTPPNGTTLDPFFGSGTSGKAVLIENQQTGSNIKFIGIEKSKEYYDTCVARCQFEFEKSIKQAA